MHFESQIIDEQNEVENIQYQKNSTTEKVTLIHRPDEKTTIEYVFDTEPLRLTVINNKTRNRIFENTDYRTNNGLNFAHSLIKNITAILYLVLLLELKGSK